MRLGKRILATALAGVILAGGAGAGNTASAATTTANYYLHYASNAPSTVNNLVDDVTVKSTRKEYVTVKSTQFYMYISGANMYTKGKTLENTSVYTEGQSVNEKKTYKLYYQKNYVPRANVSVNVTMKLRNYADSRSVQARGQVSA